MRSRLEAEQAAEFDWDFDLEAGRSTDPANNCSWDDQVT
jgi:hypothetical protein